ncbi:hypothetical protein [Flavobacterium sp. GSA192]|uniref:hypothetical protein n=1 Tax=Flavobacterium sp. GSA192 TaxID=2576304 RepID=UPI001127A643|nr:hypothetical protein [Flavobacterium sp. GSA192]
MKNKLILLTSIIAISCQNNVPKCDDPEVTKTIYSILSENKDKIKDRYGVAPLSFYPNEKINSEYVKLSEIITTNKDSELKSCGCEAKLSIATLFNKGYDSNGNVKIKLIDKLISEGVIQYMAQSNSEEGIIVKVEDISQLESKHK